MMMHFGNTRLLLAGAALLTLSGQAFALDGNDVLAKINATYAAQGVKMVATSVKTEGKRVTLLGAKIQPPAEPEKAFPIGDITMDGVDEADGGGYQIDQISLSDVKLTEEGTRISAEDIYFSGVTVPGTASDSPLGAMLLSDEGHIGPVKISKDGKDLFSLSEVTMATTRDSDDTGMAFKAAFKDIAVDLSTVDDPASKDAIQKLALTHLAGEMTMKGSWELTKGVIDVEDFTVDFDNIGALTMAYNISGYTADFIKSMQETIKAAAENPNKEQAQQASGLAMLGLVQQLNFNSAEISFTDDSITKRALDFAGKQQGMSGKQLTQTIKALTPLMMAQLNMPDLQNEVSAAVNTYLDNPKSLTITAKPPQPVPFPMIAGAAMGAPNTVPAMLGLTVKAND
jgi:hypothetical protein